MTAGSVVLIPESGPQIGMGHVYRLISMAQMLNGVYSVSFIAEAAHAAETIRKAGFDGAVLSFGAELLTDRLEAGTIAVFDGYHFSHDLFVTLRQKGVHTIYLDDFAHSFPPADIVLNTADLENTPEIPTVFSQYVYGQAYILLRKEFLSLQKRERDLHEGLQSLFVCLGATDPAGLTVPLVTKLSEWAGERENDRLKITVLSSSMNKQLQTLAALPETTLLLDAEAETIAAALSQHDAAIVAPGNVAQECIASGIPLACIQTADNQQHLYTSLTASGLCYPLGSSETFLERLPLFLQQLEDESFRMQQLQRQRKHIDGKSPERIRSLVASLQLVIRDVTPADSALLLEWKNDPVSLANSFNSTPVTRQAHEQWLQNELEGPCPAMYILELHGQPVSLVRFSRKEKKAVIGITIAPGFRGQRLAARSLILACTRYFEKFPDHVIEACIKPENTASVRAFRSAGFSFSRTVEVSGIPALLLTKTSNGELTKHGGFC